jgi:hypothetical protein
LSTSPITRRTSKLSLSKSSLSISFILATAS